MRGAASSLVVAGLAVAFCAAPALAAGPVYDIGTLTFHAAGVPVAPTYDVGTLTFHGAGVPVAPTYDVGTLVFHGAGAPARPVVYNVGTLRFVGNPKPKAKSIIDLGKIFGKPSGATDTAPVTAPAQKAPLSKYRLKLLGRQPADPPPSTLH